MPDIYGITINQPPPGWTCLEAIIICKALNDQGRPTMFIRTSDGLWDIEALGMLTAACDTTAQSVAEGFEDDDPDTKLDDG